MFAKLGRWVGIMLRENPDKIKIEIELDKDDIDAFAEILVAGSLTAKCRISRSLITTIGQVLTKLWGEK